MSNDTYYFPSAIGGTPLTYDFTPAVLFAALYAALLPMIVFRFYKKETRTLVLIGSLMFALERIVDFSLRADEALVPSRRTNREFIIYLQSAYATGYSGMAKDLVILLRAYLVETTRGVDLKANPDEMRSLDNEGESRYSSSEYLSLSPFAKQDEPERRAFIRRACMVMVLFGWTNFAIGAVSGGYYYDAITSASRARLVQQLRYVSAFMTMIELLFVVNLSLWAYSTRPKRVRATPLVVLVGVAGLVCIVTIYRLVAMRDQTTSILSTAPGSLNTLIAKALFYALHIAPEFIATVILLSVNIKEMFHTGLRGDTQMSDEPGNSKIGGAIKGAWSRLKA